MSLVDESIVSETYSLWGLWPFVWLEMGLWAVREEQNEGTVRSGQVTIPRKWMQELLPALKCSRGAQAIAWQCQEQLMAASLYFIREDKHL